MNKYESIIVINVEIGEKEIKNVISKVKNIIMENGMLEEIEECGKKRLAYPIAKQNEGYYVLINFSSNPDFIEELERVYNITDEVIKHIIVKK